MMSRPSLRRITARLHIHHIMSIVMLAPHYDGSRWTSDTCRMKFRKKYRKGEIRQTFLSIFQVTAYISARCFIIICFKMLILLHFRTPCYKKQIYLVWNASSFGTNHIPDCSPYHWRSINIDFCRELQRPVIHGIELDFEQPTYEVIVGGSKKGTNLLFSSDGFAYTVKQENLDHNTIYWRCTSRAKGHCPASVVHTSDDDEEYFHQSYAGHIRLMLLMTVKARKEVSISINDNSK